MQVVNIRDLEFQLGVEDYYIGRYNEYHHLPASTWANPFGIFGTRTREESIELYAGYIREMIAKDPETYNLERLTEYERLVCWCKPKACHGDVLLELIEERGVD